MAALKTLYSPDFLLLQKIVCIGNRETLRLLYRSKWNKQA